MVIGFFKSWALVASIYRILFNFWQIQSYFNMAVNMASDVFVQGWFYCLAFQIEM